VLMRSILLVIVVLFQSYHFQLRAQQPPMSFGLDELEKKSEKQLKKTLPSEIKPLESKINPDEYRVGPGDLLQIDIRGPVPDKLELRITPEQNLILPGVGEIDLTDLTLRQAKDKIRNFITQKYRNSQVSIALTDLREFRVHVTGAVNEPGSVIMNGNQRVSDAINEAEGFLEELMPPQSIEPETPEKEITLKPEPEEEFQPPSKRNIKLVRKNGDTLVVDILRFIQGGDPSANPFLLDGDIIVVPNEQEEVGRIAIWGAVRTPGEFEFAANDNLATLLNLSHGFTLDADKSKIEIIRFNADHRTTRVIPADLSENSGLTPESIPLFPDDRVYVRRLPRFNRKAQVTLEGEVRYPGKYRIVEGFTTLTDIVAEAGGLTPQASLMEASMIRKSLENFEDPEFERLKVTRTEAMTDQEREYFKMRFREIPGAVAVDFVSLFEAGDESKDIVLFDEDEITIPSTSKTIRVFGQVVRPGLITFEPGKTFSYYIEKAGGYNWNARKGWVRIIRGQTGEWFKPDKNTKILLGDIIYIPENPERDYWELTKDYVQIAYQITTIFLVIYQTKLLMDRTK